jgi:hypothetical protein
MVADAHSGLASCDGDADRGAINLEREVLPALGQIVDAVWGFSVWQSGNPSKKI